MHASGRQIKALLSQDDALGDHPRDFNKEFRSIIQQMKLGRLARVRPLSLLDVVTTKC